MIPPERLRVRQAIAAATHRNHASTATIAFGSTATVLIPARQRPTHVLDITPGSGTSAFNDAVKLRPVPRPAATRPAADA